jgi:hypothetical protein
MDVTKLLRNRKSHETSDNYDGCGRKVDITSINCTRLVVPNSLCKRLEKCNVIPRLIGSLHSLEWRFLP